MEGMRVGPGQNTIASVYVLLLTLASIHLYNNPIYDMDSIQYMGNALLMEEMNPVIVHQRVYAEIKLADSTTLSGPFTGPRIGRARRPAGFSTTACDKIPTASRNTSLYLQFALSATRLCGS
jgi:hypothetical protein